MTTVEFLYRCPTENIASALTLRPDKIIFIGGNDGRSDDIYTRFIKSKSPSTKVKFIYTDTNDLYNLINILSDIIKTENDITFDLTGGENLMLTAMGVALERYKDEKNIAVQRFDIKNDKVLLWKNGEKSIASISAFLSVGEQIALHGGMVVEVPADEIILNPKTEKEKKQNESKPFEIDLSPLRSLHARCSFCILRWRSNRVRDRVKERNSV